MALALTKFEAYGIQIDEPVTKRFVQRAVIEWTGATSDITIDIANYAGTFWTAVGATEPGLTAIKALKDIQIKAKALVVVGGLGVVNLVRGTAAAAGVYSQSVSALLPSITYFTAEGPTSAKLVLEWELNDAQSPVKVTKTA
jgi:hypothetical protein